MATLHRVRTGFYTWALAWALACIWACGSRGSRTAHEEAPAPAATELPALMATATDQGASREARVEAIDKLGRATPGDAQVATALRALWTEPDQDGAIVSAALAGLRRVSGQGAIDFSRVAIIGASVSAGFMGSPVAVELDTGIEPAHSIENLADVFFFRAVRKNGTEQVTAALAARPTLVLALDFLFWYTYMSGVDTEYRLASLERGLSELERFQGVPVMVGDIPDMRGAAAWMLPPEAVPPVADLEAVNQRIRAWARDKANVEVVPLTHWAEPLFTGASVEYQGQKLTANDLMSPDGLHLNPRGVRYLLHRLDEHMTRAFPDTPEAALRIEDRD